LWKFERYYSAGTLVEAATSQSRWSLYASERVLREYRMKIL